MTDSNTSPNTQPAASPSGGLLGQVSLATLLSVGAGVISSVAGAGWPGIIMLGILGAALPFGWSKLVGIFNGWADSRDADRAGTDAGATAVDMANQGHAVNAGLNQLEQSDPPTAGFPPEKP
jgi:hypothetical protein